MVEHQEKRVALAAVDPVLEPGEGLGGDDLGDVLVAVGKVVGASSRLGGSEFG